MLGVENKSVALRHAVLLVILLLGAFPGVDGSSHGMEGLSAEGCSCHGDSNDEGARVSVAGLPEAYTPGLTYDLIVTLEGGPTASANGHQGGFNLAASAGTLGSIDGTTRITDDGEVTHDHPGANQRTWMLTWTAPEATTGPVNITVAGNVVDGDHQPTEGDDWALAAYSVGEGETDPVAVASQAAQGLLPILLLGAVAFWFWRSSRR
jgi:hypothetical protein